MAGLVLARKWEKRNGIDFYWVMLSMYTIWDLKSLWIFQMFLFLDFRTNIPKYIPENI